MAAREEDGQARERLIDVALIDACFILRHVQEAVRSRKRCDMCVGFCTREERLGSDGSGAIQQVLSVLGYLVSNLFQRVGVEGGVWL